MPKPNWVSIQHLSTAQIELSIECGNHPELCDILKDNIGEPFEILLGHIAAYCEVMVDGMYMPEEIDILCDKLTDKLRQKRSLIVLPTSRLVH